MAEQMALALEPKPATQRTRPHWFTDEVTPDEAGALQSELLSFLSVPAAAGEPWVDWSDIHHWFCCMQRYGPYHRDGKPLCVHCFQDDILRPLLISHRIRERPRYYTSSDPRDPNYAGWHPQYALSAWE